MTLYYLDPSAWVKRHFQEEGSSAVNELFRASIRAACCRLGFVEMAATIARKSHGESLGPSVTQSLLENVTADFASFRVVPVDEEYVSAATELALRYRLRAMDALHLACAMSLRAVDDVVMVSADAELLAAARQERLVALDPAQSGT